MLEETKDFSFVHKPVLLEEVLTWLSPCSGGIYVDCTLGGAGHSRAILESSSPNGRLIGIDQDEDALKVATKRLENYQGRVTLVKENFKNLDLVLDSLKVKAVNGILIDLGVSSYQLDNPARGFSYMQDAPLDMRMDKNSSYSARDVLNNLSQKELAQIIYRYGEEKYASKIASAIVKEREKSLLESTGRLVEIIKRVIPAKARREGPHPAKRTFQAIRIEVNQELEIIKDTIFSAVNRLEVGGRLCVISFHSLEDRLVKQSIRELANPCTCPKSFPVCVCQKKPLVKDMVSKGIKASEEELLTNPRSRSARLRVIEKIKVL